MTDERRAGPVRPTPERMAQGGVIIPDEDKFGRPKPWHTFESAHDGLLAAGLISQRGWHAANVFQQTYRLACGSGTKASNWEVRIDGDIKDFSQEQANAVSRVQRWSRSLAPALFSCLESVLGLGVASSRWARDRGEHPASGRLMLVSSVEQLALMLPAHD